MTVQTLTPNHCGCGCRPAGATEPGCPCPECQPGPGVNYTVRRSQAYQRRAARMRVLLEKDELTKEENAELEELFAHYIYSS